MITPNRMVILENNDHIKCLEYPHQLKSELMIPGLSLRFDSTIALVFTPIANL